MKPFSKQTNKWLLSTMMVAALGSQYYFSIASNKIGSFDMSSTKAEDTLSAAQKKVDDDPKLSKEQKQKAKEVLTAAYAKKLKEDHDSNATKTEAQKEADSMAVKAKSEKSPEAAQEEREARNRDEGAQAQRVKSADAKVVLAPVEKKAAVDTAGPVVIKANDTEGHSYQVYCPECAGEDKWISVNTTKDNILDIATFLNKKQVTTVAPAAPVVAKQDEEKEHGFETARERRVREKEERDEKKREIKQAKEDKLREAKEDRNDAFAEKAEDIADKCQDDLTCKVDRFASLMNSYSGTKKVDSFAVTAAYNKIIDKDLKAGLRGEDGSEGKTAALAAIESLMGQVPNDYKSLKNRTVDTVKAAQISQATAVNDLYKQAEAYKSQHKLNEEIQARGEAIKDGEIFKNDVRATFTSMKDGLETSKDQVTLDYIKQSYIPDINALAARLANIGGLTDTATTTSTGNRSGRNGSATTINGTVPVQSSSGNNLSGVNFGAPSVNRAVNRTGVNFK